MGSTSTLIATGLGCPGDTETAVIGFLIANQLTHKAEVNHCITHKITHNLYFSLWDDLNNSEAWCKNKQPPYLTSGTVTELSAMFVERIICKYKQQEFASCNIHHIPSNPIQGSDFRVNFTFLYPGTGTRNTPFCSSKVTVEWRGYTCNLWANKHTLTFIHKYAWISTHYTQMYLLRTSFERASFIYWISASPGRKTSTLPLSGWVTLPVCFKHLDALNWANMH